VDLHVVSFAVGFMFAIFPLMAVLWFIIRSEREKPPPSNGKPPAVLYASPLELSEELIPPVREWLDLTDEHPLYDALSAAIREAVRVAERRARTGDEAAIETCAQLWLLFTLQGSKAGRRATLALLSASSELSKESMREVEALWKHRRRALPNNDGASSWLGGDV
jgi:hypothetical protein